MRFLIGVLLLLGALPASEVYPRLEVPRENRLRNPDFEAVAGDQLPGWNAFEAGYQVAAGEGRGGTTAAVCERRADADRGAGASQTIELNQTVATPVLVTGWSKAAGVSGSADSDYALYCDLVHTDGTPLWGQTSPFATGNHDWQRREVLISPTRPIRSLTVYALFRKHRGRVWFDDFQAATMKADSGTAELDAVPVTPRDTPASGAARELTAGRLRLDLSGDRIVRVRLGEQDVTGPHPGGFLARDAAAETGFHDFTGGACDELGLALQWSATTQGEGLVIDGVVRDTRGTDRAVTLVCALPVAAVGWQWGDDIGASRPVAAGVSLANDVRLEAGANGRLSRYPFATVSGPAGGLAVGLDSRRPQHYRVGYSASTGLLYIAFDCGLTPLTRRSPSAASFRVVLFSHRGDWGFRAALDTYQRLFPESFRLRTPEQGIWMAFAPISKVAGWEDFGFKFKEGNDEVAWDDAHNITTFRYSEMGTWWMSMAKEVPRETPQALELLRKYAADQQSRQYTMAQATLASAMHDREGQPQLLFRDTPWCDGCVFSLNPSPYLPGLTQATVCWGPERQKAYAPGVTPVLDGEYLDSLEGYVTAPLNFRPDHLAEAVIPPTFTTDDHRPVLHKAFSIGEYVAWLCDDLHARGKLTMANSVPSRYGFMTAWFDVMGTETDWGRGGRYTPDDDTAMRLRRSLAGKRPYLLLLNTRFADFGPYVERYFQRALAYGMLPSMFSHNAAQDHYFTKPEWYNRDRELFKQYIPRIRQVAEEGWEPLTGARCDNPAITVERFGPGPTQRVFLTVHNPGDQPQTGRLTGEADLLGVAWPPREVSLQPYETQVIEVGRRG